jgi:hypothetical protein
MTGARPSDRAMRWVTAIDGHQIRQLRCQRGPACEELAALAGISLDTLAKLERERGSMLSDANAGQARRRTARPGCLVHTCDRSAPAGQTRCHVTRNIAGWVISGTVSNAALFLRPGVSTPGFVLLAAGWHGTARRTAIQWSP